MEASMATRSAIREDELRIGGIPPDARERVGWSSARKVAGFAATVVGLALIALLYARVARSFELIADDATGVLEAEAVLQGNYLLHGWTTSRVSFYTTDLPFYVIGVFFRGVHPTLLHRVPAAIYTLTLALAVRMAGRGRRHRRSTWFGMAVTFVLMGLPSGVLAHQAFSVNVRVGTTLLILVSLSMLDTAPGRAVSWARYSLFTLALALAIVGDKFALLIGALPVILVCAGRIFRAGRGDGPNNAILIASCFCAIAAASVTSRLIEAAGGFRVVPSPFRFVGFHVFLNNFTYLTEGVLELYRANFFGRVLDGRTALRLLGLLGLGLVAYSTYRAFPVRRAPGAGEEGEADFLSEILSVAIVINIGTYVLGHEAVNLMTMRYLLPAFIFGAVLAGRFGVESASGARRLYPGVAVLAMAYMTFLGKGLLSPPASDPHGFAGLAEWLYSRSLTYGYGTYWTSSITTAASANRVKVRAVRAEGGQIKPLVWMADREWYRGTPAHFLVSWTSYGAGDPRFTMSLQEATDALGPPSEVSRVGEYIVMIWDKDITPCLGPPFDIDAENR
jgi:hypothetical protein